MKRFYGYGFEIGQLMISYKPKTHEDKQKLDDITKKFVFGFLSFQDNHIIIIGHYFPTSKDFIVQSNLILDPNSMTYKVERVENQ